MNDVIAIACLSGKFKDILKYKDKATKETKNFYKFIQYAYTYSLKALDEKMLDLPQEERDRVIKQIKRRELMICFKGEHVNQIKETIRQNKAKTIENEKLNTLLDLCSASCSVCDMNAEDCEYFEVLRELNVEPLKTEVEKGGCCYRY